MVCRLAKTGSSYLPNTQLALVWATIFLLMVVSGAKIVGIGTRNTTFVFLLRPFLSSVAGLVPSELEEVRARFSALGPFGDAGRNRAYEQRLSGLVRLLTRPSNIALDRGRKRLGEIPFDPTKNDSERSKELLQQTLSTSPDIIRLEAHLRLALILAKQGDLAGYEQEMKAAASFSSTRLIRTDFCPGWRLQGVLVDAHELILNQPVHLILVWRLPQNQVTSLPIAIGSPMASPDDLWRLWTWHDYVFQLGIQPNLVTDGGLEHIGLPYQGIPPQLPFSLHGSEGPYTALVYANPDQHEDIVLQINGQGQMGSIGLSTLPIGIVDRENTAYLVLGSYRSEGTALPRIGIRWLLEQAKTFRDNASTFVVTRAMPEWTSFAALLIPPKDASELQYWVVNSDRSSNLQVNDLGLWLVPLPCKPIQGG
jgi:hypothetical protein